MARTKQTARASMAMVASRAWAPLCGCYILVDHKPMYLPHVMVDIHATILDTISHTTLTQTFINPSQDVPIEEVKYIFPLFDGVSVTAVSCIVGDRTITGVVKERQKAKEVYEEAKSLGKTAGLFEQSLEAADVFFTSIGNVPAGGEVTVVITYLGELKHDAEIDGVRLTIPTRVAPRYGNATIQGSLVQEKGMSITVDTEMAEGSTIKSLQSPSHPISINIGKLSTELDGTSEPSLCKASATLTRHVSALDKDFIIEVAATKLGEPSAFLETHPTIPDQRALMVSLVPKFRLSSEKPEVVFICDRSGSMMGWKIRGLVNALHIFLKSLPIGVKFNIASFGSKYSFLWPRSKTYDQDSLDEATDHINTFSADYGGTEIYAPMESAFQRQYKDMNLEVFLLTDGDIWAQERLFKFIEAQVTETKGKTRVFSLGIGSGASSSLIEGVARAGHGFAQYIQDGETMDKKLMRMLKGALLPHLSDCTLEIKYESEQDQMQLDDEDEGFEVIEYVLDSLHIDTSEPSSPKAWPTEPSDSVPLFDLNFDEGDHSLEAGGDATIDKYQHLPHIETPRYLQTPTEIPPLYPFSRTTVYILLSETTPQRKIKSVFLNAATQQGNLTLEIPVVNLTRESTTIHQLAARKEIKELEEGRGWLTKAKDNDGELLKNKLDGRFSDMLEREAVRLGLQFQVSGKWCSFVAVEGMANDEADVKGKQPQRNEAAKSSGSPDQSSSSMGVAKATQPMRASTGGAAPRKQLASNACRKSAPSVTPIPVKRPRKQLASKAARKSAPSTAPVSTGQRGKGLGVGGAKRHRRIVTSPEPREDDGEQADSETGSQGSPEKRVTFDGLESPIRKRTKRTATIDPSNKLQALISLQTFSGAWLWGSSLEKVLGITAERVLSMKLPASVLKHARKEDILATACAVAFLKKSYPGDKETWEMLVDKAEESVKSQIGDDLYKLEKIFKALF